MKFIDFVVDQSAVIKMRKFFANRSSFIFDKFIYICDTAPCRKLGASELEVRGVL